MNIMSIVLVVWEDSGDIVAYDNDNQVVTRLTAQGLEELRTQNDKFLFRDERKPDTFSIPKDHYDKPVRIVIEEYVDRTDLPEQADGVDLKPGDRILLASQPKAVWVGVHAVRAAPTPNNPRRLRASLVPIEVIGTCVVVKEGSHGGQVWSLAAPGVWTRRLS